MSTRAVLAGAAGALAARTLVIAGVRAKLNRDLRALNAGDAAPLLANYADDAVLRFNEGEHRWAGTHRGKAAIAAFLREFTTAGVQGEIKDLWLAGPPWAARIAVRFDDWASAPGNGRRLYANRTVLTLRTRWGRVVEHEDFYEDTGRILAFDRELTALGVPAVRAG